MVRRLAAVGSLAAVVTVVASCVPATLGGNGGGSSDAAPPCTGTLVPERRYRSCDGAVVSPLDGACPDGYVYSPAHCARPTLNLLTNACGADAAGDSADASDGGAGEIGDADVSSCTDLVNDAPPAIQQFQVETRPASELG